MKPAQEGSVRSSRRTLPALLRSLPLLAAVAMLAMGCTTDGAGQEGAATDEVGQGDPVDVLNTAVPGLEQWDTLADWSGFGAVQVRPDGANRVCARVLFEESFAPPDRVGGQCLEAAGLDRGRVLVGGAMYLEDSGEAAIGGIVGDGVEGLTFGVEGGDEYEASLDGEAWIVTVPHDSALTAVLVHLADGSEEMCAYFPTDPIMGAPWCAP